MNSRYNIIGTVMLLFALACNGCGGSGKKAVFIDGPFEIYLVHGGDYDASLKWEISAKLNGQPIRSLWKVSDSERVCNFVIDGDNELEITAFWHGDADDISPLDYRLIDVSKSPDLYSTPLEDVESIGSLSVPDPKHKIYNKTIKFKAKMSVTWRWQESDEIVDFTAEDRASVLSILDKLVDALKERDEQRYRDNMLRWWPEDVERYYRFTKPTAEMLKMDFLKRGFKAFREYGEDYIVIPGDPSTYKMANGSRLVRVWRDRDMPLFQAGLTPEGVAKAKKGGCTMSMQPKVLHFVKKGGRWYLLADI